MCDSLLAGVLSSASYSLIVALFIYASVPCYPLGFKQKGPVGECFGYRVRKPNQSKAHATLPKILFSQFCFPWKRISSFPLLLPFATPLVLYTPSIAWGDVQYISVPPQESGTILLEESRRNQNRHLRISVFWFFKKNSTA